MSIWLSLAVRMCCLDCEREIPDFSAPLPLAMDTTVSVPTGVSSPSLSALLPFKAEILPLPDAKVQLL